MALCAPPLEKIETAHPLTVKSSPKNTEAHTQSHTMQVNAPAYHMRIMDLDAIQAAERNLFMKKHREERIALCQKQQRDRVELRQQHRDARLRAKAEKALHDKSKIEPDFWTYFPNHEGRRDTMEAVLVSLGQPKEATELMPAYAAWLLTANKTHENGRPKNRWALMTAFIESRLPPPGEVKGILKPQSVIVQMLIESGTLVVGHTVPRI